MSRNQVEIQPETTGIPTQGVLCLAFSATRTLLSHHHTHLSAKRGGGVRGGGGYWLPLEKAEQGSLPLLCRTPHPVLQAEHELRLTQTEFDRQAEVTRLLLEGISSTHVSLPG